MAGSNGHASREVYRYRSADKSLFFWGKRNHRDDHLFQGDSSVLKSIGVIICEVIVIIGIDEKVGILREDVAGTDIPGWKEYLSGIGNFKNLL